YAQIGNLGTYDEWIARNAAALPVSSQQFYGEGTDNAISGSTIHYMDLTDLSRTDPQGPLPMRVRGGLEPMRPINVGYFGQGASAIDENIRNPLTHSLNVSLTRNIRSSLTLDVRYIGTFGRNMINGIDINQNDYINSGLARELDFIRRNASYQSDLINSLLPPGGLASPFVIPATLSGSDQLRHRSGQASNLAQMNYNAIVTTLATGNGNYGTVTGENGRIFRHGCLPTQRMDPGGDMADHVGNPCLYHTPLNYFRLNPQSGSATIQTNVSKSSYHSMQTQVTMRPMHGLNFQATWTWSRALGNGGAWWNLYGDREWNLTTQHRSHTLNIFGSYELPFGPRGLLLRDSTGFIKKTVEGWQLSWVIASRAGSPMSITGQTTQWGTNFPILVRPDLWDDKAGQIETRWNDDGTYAGGRYWGDKYTRVMDPGVCNPENMDPNLYNLYCWDSNANAGLGAIRNTGNIRAIALADPKRPDTDPQTGAPYATLYAEDTIGADGVLYKKGTPVIVFRNATGTFGSETYNPLSRGTYRNNRITAPGQFTFDAAISKSIEFMEGKRIELRVDVGNILNHPTATGNYPADVRYMSGGRSTTPDPPANLNINTTGAAAVGNMPSKTQHRIFQAKVRIAF
ncbi:MAG: hypothetical protein FWF13_07300, partial [Acidobacteria bacterium]|nr:hypothetical protein [Acidobacteriota bacterium]